MIATHDIDVLPLGSYVLGKVVEAPDYLDGIVIGKEGDNIRAGYGELTCTKDLSTG